MLKIHIKNFQIFGSKKTRDVSLDFSKSKVVITGNNGTGKSSIINLVFGLLTNQMGLVNHVRYDNITFENESEKYEVETNKSFKTLNDISGEELEMVRGNMIIIKRSLGDVTTVADGYGDEQLKLVVRKANNTLSTNDIASLVDYIRNKSLGFEIEKNEPVQLSISGKLSTVRLKNVMNSSVNNISIHINAMNSNIDTLRKKNKGIQLKGLQDKMIKDIEYISIFRGAEEYIKNDGTSRNYINPSNSLLIQYELAKPSVEAVIKNINDETLSTINTFKVNFFDNVAANCDGEILDNYDFLEDLSKLSNDTTFSKVNELLKTKDEYKRSIGKFFSPLARYGGEYKKKLVGIEGFLTSFNRALNDGKEIVMEGSSMMFKTSEVLKPLIVGDLSAGEKQMFKLLSVLHLSDKKFLIFDEPEISLSILWQQILKESINNFARVKGNNVLIVTHSPYMITKNDLRKENKIIASLDV